MPFLPMPTSTPADQPHTLRQRLRNNGFLFFPGLVSAAQIAQLRAEVRGVLAANGWLADPADGSLTPRRPARHGATGWWRMYEQIQALERFHALARTRALTMTVRGVLGGRVLNHPRRQLTMVSPRFWIPPHQEHLHIQGTPDTLTAWMPLVPTEPGQGLQVLAETDLRRLRPVQRDRHHGVGIQLDVAEDTWFASINGFQPGDAVLVHALAVRRTVPHAERELLLSAEYRYQPAWEPVSKGSLLPQHYPRLPGWSTLTRGWSTRRWIRTPLIKQIVPYTMPTCIEEWHNLLPSVDSALVDVQSPSANALG